MSTAQSVKKSGLLLLGTDTNVGKTVVACALLRLAAQRGLWPVPWKPVETGVVAPALPADALALNSASRLDLPLRRVCPFPLPLPVAPAAHRNHPEISEILASRSALLGYGDLFIVESAGGVLTPFTPTFVGADLAVSLGIPVILVARNALGTINHTCLAYAELRRREILVAAIILVNTTGAPTPDRADNAALIAAQTGMHPLGPFPFVPSLEPDALALAAATFCEGDHLLSLAGTFKGDPTT